MPDGQSLSKYLTFDTESKHASGKRRSKSRKGKRGKDEIWEHLKHQQVPTNPPLPLHPPQASANDEPSGYHSEKDEFKIVEKMGSRRRRRWLNDKYVISQTSFAGVRILAGCCVT